MPTSGHIGTVESETEEKEKTMQRSDSTISHETEEKENEVAPLNVSSQACSPEPFSANKQNAGDKKMKFYGIQLHHQQATKKQP